MENKSLINKYRTRNKEQGTRNLEVISCGSSFDIPCSIFNIRYSFGFVIILFFCGFLGGCYYDVEEELYQTIECSTEDLSFQDDILPIIDNRCYGCHNAASNFGGVNLEGHNQLKIYVDNNQLLGVIRHESGFSPMPKNAAPLLECEVEKIEAWVLSGAPNN